MNKQINIIVTIKKPLQLLHRVLNRSKFLVAGVYFISSMGTAATYGSLIIDMGARSPLSINTTLTGSMDSASWGAISTAPWLKFRTLSKFMLPEAVTLGGNINGTITSTNTKTNRTYTRNFSIDMSTLDQSWGPGNLLDWPDKIEYVEPAQFTDQIFLTGNVIITNSSTSPVVVNPLLPFIFWAHGFNSWEVQISGTVPAKSVCTVTISPSAISLGDISLSELTSAASGARLDGMSGTANVVTQCTGTESAKLNLTTAVVSDDNCAVGDNKSLNFCTESGGSKININGDALKISGKDISDGHSTEVTFYATKGENPSIGKSSSFITIVASPE